MRDQDSNLAFATYWSCHLGLVNSMCNASLSHSACSLATDTEPVRTGLGVAQYHERQFTEQPLSLGKSSVFLTVKHSHCHPFHQPAQEKRAV